MQIATWNVNSIRIRLNQVVAWLEANPVDVLCLQETKVVDEQFPRAEFQSLGYHCHISGQKSYNGVAILSRSPLGQVTTGFSPILDQDYVGEFDEQRRLIAGVMAGIRVISVYVPNGGGSPEKYAYKLHWLKLLQEYLSIVLTQPYPVCICGDFNIAPDDRDIYFVPESTVVGTTDIERQLLEEIRNLGLLDVFRHFHSDSGLYSWWDYREGGFRRNRGWRIDLIYACQRLLDQATSCQIDLEPRRQPKPSDHTPVIAEFG
jgi:exodeoxyribonuclease-3